MLYVEVILPVSFLGQTFTYSVSGSLVEPLVGSRVQVPFRNSSKVAIISSVHNVTPHYKVKSIIEIIDTTPILNKAQIELLEWASQYYLCPVGDVLRVTLPKGIRAADYFPPKQIAYNINAINLEYLEQHFKRRPALKRALDIILNLSEGHRITLPHHLLQKKGITTSGVKNLLEFNVISKTEIDIDVYHDIQVVPSNSSIKASSELHSVIEELSTTTKPLLLLGNSTQCNIDIFKELISYNFHQGKQTLILTPNNYLSQYITEMLGDDTILRYDTSVSIKSRSIIYLRLLNSPHSVKAIVGTGISLLLPHANLAHIVVVEESNFAYKSDRSPRINYRDLAFILSQKINSKIVLTSDVFSVDSYSNCHFSRWCLLDLRVRSTVKITLLEKGRKELLSSYLIKRMEQVLERKQQVVIFQNRRGFAGSTQCLDCGNIIMCNRCNVMLTHHQSSTTFKCHYCGYTLPLVRICPSCHSPNLVSQGMGTERVYDILKGLFTEAKISRIDSDTISRKETFGEMRSDIEASRYDIIIGTQQLLGGLIIPNLALIGVVNADNMFLSTDFRTTEKSIGTIIKLKNLLINSDEGELIIQSSNSQHPILKKVVSGATEDFYQDELHERQSFQYPPYVRLIILRLSHKSKSYLHQLSLELDIVLQQYFSNKSSAPYEPLIDKIDNEYRLEILLRFNRDNSLSIDKQKLSDIVSKFRVSHPLLSLVIDVDPI